MRTMKWTRIQQHGTKTKMTTRPQQQQQQLKQQSLLVHRFNSNVNNVINNSRIYIDCSGMPCHMIRIQSWGNLSASFVIKRSSLSIILKLVNIFSDWGVYFGLEIFLGFGLVLNKFYINREISSIWT